MTSPDAFIGLHSAKLTLLLDCRQRTPALLYFGARLSAQTQGEMLARLASRQEAKCSPVFEAPVSLSPLNAEGFTGAPGLRTVRSTVGLVGRATVD